MPNIEHNGAHLQYQHHGTTGPNVLFIMGIAVSQAGWKPQVSPLSSHIHAITFDNRGVGQSAGKAGLWTTAQLAEDARAVVDAADWDGFHVVGVSMGGMVAQELALSMPGRVHSLSLIATHPGGLVSLLPPLQGLSLFPKIVFGRRKTRLRAFSALLYPPSERAAAVRRLTNGAPGLSWAPPAILAAQIAAVCRHNTHRRLHQLEHIPTLILQPKRDVLVHPKGSTRLANAIPNATLVTFPDAGHGINVQSATAVNQHLLQHILAAETHRQASPDKE